MGGWVGEKGIDTSLEKNRNLMLTGASGALRGLPVIGEGW